MAPIGSIAVKKLGVWLKRSKKSVGNLGGIALFGELRLNEL
jgi:hypothetical protein